MNFRLALITGATGGLGKALCQALAKRKIPLFLTSTNREALHELSKDLQTETSVEFHAADLSLPASREEILKMIREKAPDLVINNAGYGLYGEALSHPFSQHLKLIDVDALSVMEISMEAAKALIAKNSHGTILNVSSIAAFLPLPFHAVYGASKAFVNQFSIAFAREVEPHGIRILVSCPGQIDTSFKIRASKGTFTQKQGYSMSAEKAAREILRQIEHGPTLRIIDGFYRIALCIARLLPRSWVEKKLASNLQKRK